MSTSTFSDLQPTELDAAGVMGGAAFLDGPAIFIPLPGGAYVTLAPHID